MPKRYLIEMPYFDGKHLHPAGSIISVPDDVIPSVTWRDADTGELVKVPRSPTWEGLSKEEKELILELRGEKAKPPEPPKAAAPEPQKPPEPPKKDKRASDKDAI